MGPPVRRLRAHDEPRARESPTQILAGRALVGGKLQPVEIALGAGGEILSLRRIQTGGPRHDVGDSIILPAATDLHVHLRDPGRADSGESIASGTVSAALGGVGLVAEMPNTDPPVTSVERLEEKEARVRGRAAVDVLLYALAGRGPARALSLRAGAFKIYLSPSSQVEEVPSAEELPRLLEELSGTDLPVAVHAEDPSRFRGGGPPKDPAGWDRARPPSAEAAAIERLASRPDRLRLHVAHVTTRESVRRLRDLGASFEATPHHLLLSDRSGTDARFKVNPPLRPEAERAALWAAFAAGEIPVLASDHAPHLPSAKSGEFFRAPSGMPGVETMLPLLLERVRQGDLSLEVLLDAACDRPARWLGQPLGRLAPGHRGNLLVVDFRAREKLSASRLSSACGWTAFEGWDAIRPVEHWQDGVQIVAGGEYVGRPQGRVVRPEYAPSPVPPPVEPL
jgi:dihydroorotase